MSTPERIVRPMRVASAGDARDVQVQPGSDASEVDADLGEPAAEAQDAPGHDRQQLQLWQTAALVRARALCSRCAGIV